MDVFNLLKYKIAGKITSVVVILKLFLGLDKMKVMNWAKTEIFVPHQITG
jgi:hypothetical protein